MEDSKRRAESLRLEHEIEAIQARLRELEMLRLARQARLQSAKGKLWRDGIGAMAGVLLAELSSGASLLLVFWTITAVLTDRLDIQRENVDRRLADAECEQLIERLAVLTRELNALDRSQRTAPEPC